MVAAFEAVYASYKPLVWGSARAIVRRNPGLGPHLDDLAQIGWLELWELSMSMDPASRHFAGRAKKRVWWGMLEYRRIADAVYTPKNVPRFEATALTDEIARYLAYAAPTFERPANDDVPADPQAELVAEARRLMAHGGRVRGVAERLGVDPRDLRKLLRRRAA
jgi:hypothetical protein